MITVELKEEVTNWNKNRNRIPENKVMQIKINFEEIDLRKKVRSFGGRWNKENKVWELPYKYVKFLNLTKRIDVEK